MLTLTTRQREILALAAQGMTAREMARRLGVSSPTIKKTLKRAFRSLHVQTKTQAVVVAWCLGLIDLPEEGQ